MTRHQPTVELLRELLAYDTETGVLTWRERRPENFTSQRACSAWNARFKGLAVGGVGDKGYLVTAVMGRRIGVHVLAFALANGRWPNGDVDHKNGCRADNRESNLRDAGPDVNAQNQRKPRADNTSGYLGVSFNKRVGKFAATLTLKKRSIHIGYFSDPSVAHQAYVAAKRELHAGCTI